MADNQELIRRLRDPISTDTSDADIMDVAADTIEALADELAAARAALRPRPEIEWHEDMGDVLWFHFPIQEPPWVGTPLTNTWVEDWYTHFLPLPDFNSVHTAIVATRREGDVP